LQYVVTGDYNMINEKVLIAKAITRSFEGTRGILRVLQGVDLEVSEGEIVVIVGASGAGKSTLLHILGTLDRPDSGTLLIKGENPFKVPEGELNRIRNTEIGFVFQFHYLLPEFNALENVMMPGVVNGRINEEIREKAISLLKDVGLEDRMYHRPTELSGGEQQRVAVARALMNNPSIVLADEPSGNLDDKNSSALHELIYSLSRTKRQSFVIVTHKKELLEKADSSYVLKEGRLFPIGDDESALSDL